MSRLIGEDDHSWADINRQSVAFSNLLDAAWNKGSAEDKLEILAEFGYDLQMLHEDAHDMFSDFNAVGGNELLELEEVLHRIAGSKPS